MEAVIRGYQGRLWDAPMTDDLPVIDLAGWECGLCQEAITAQDNAVALGGVFHLECLLRSTMGDVAHLEGRCSCFGGGDHDTEGSYREQSQRVVDWLVANHRGRWAQADL